MNEIRASKRQKVSKHMKLIEPDFWKYRGRYSRMACRDKSRIDRSPMHTGEQEPKWD